MSKELKIKCSILVLFFVSTTVTAQDLGQVWDGDTSALDNVIERSRIEDWSRDGLRMLRNTIYARYGYRFVSKELQDHFSQFSWYNGIKNNVQNELTRTDLMNIALIQSLEKNAGINFYPYSKEAPILNQHSRRNGCINIYGLIDNNRIFYSILDFRFEKFILYDLLKNQIISEWHYSNDAWWPSLIDEVNNAMAEYTIMPLNEDIEIPSSR
jgi:hypothetical protein